MRKEKPFKFKNLDDGCVIVECPKHGVLGRIVIGSEIECKQCRKWVKAADEKTNEQS